MSTVKNVVDDGGVSIVDDCNVFSVGETWRPSKIMQDMIDIPIDGNLYNDTEWLKGDTFMNKDGIPQNHYCSEPRLHNEFVSIQPNFAKKIIDQAVAKDGPFFEPEIIQKRGSPEYRKATEIIGKLLKMIGSSNDVFEASEYQKLLDRKLSEHGFIPDPYSNGELAQLMNTTEELVLKRLNEVFQEVVQEVKSDRFKRILGRRTQTADRRLKSVQHWLARAFDKHSRLLVLRVDLHFHKHMSDNLTPRKVKEWFQKFTVGLQERTKLARGFVGYAGVLEYGTNQNYHIHAIFLYDAAVRKNAIAATKLLSDYWVELTEGFGFAFDCSRSKRAADYQGIGLIHYTNEKALRELFHVVAPYICKRDEFFRVLPCGARGFWRSGLIDKVPRYERKRVGRQRQSESAPTLLDIGAPVG